MRQMREWMPHACMAESLNITYILESLRGTVNKKEETYAKS